MTFVPSINNYRNNMIHASSRLQNTAATILHPMPVNTHLSPHTLLNYT